MTVNELLGKMSSKEIAEWMAYDRTNDPAWIDSHNKSVEAEKQFDPIEQARQFKLLLRGSNT